MLVLLLLTFIPLMGACPCTCSIGTFNSIKGLQVDCQNKGITSEQLERMEFPIETKIIGLKSNKLTYIPEHTFAHIEGLGWLDLDYNNLNTLHENTFAHNTNLKVLPLNNNNLTTIHENTFAHNTNLELLYLDSNNLNTIHENTFAHNTNSKWLSLSNNNLNTIHENTFAHNTNLTRLYLYNNNLTTIHENTFAHNTNLKMLRLYNNSLHCDCRMQNMLSMSISDLSGTCQSPEIMKGTSLRSLASKLICTSCAKLDPCKNDAECFSLDEVLYECSCKQGYHSNHCERAICSTVCDADATCTSPDNCTCNAGYKGDGTTNCNPICSTVCHANATCTSPDKCTCNTGYEGDGTTNCNPQWSEWGDWSGCTKTCHDNNDINNPPTQNRVRQCEGNKFDVCDGEGEEIRACNQAVACPGSLSTWKNWEECPQTCRMGTIAPTHTRERKCIGGTWDGNCGEENPLFESKNCSVEIYCPGRLTQWSEFDLCGGICNVAGLGPYQKRYRECLDYSTWNPSFKGCVGLALEQEALCNQDIPCRGQWSEWGDWSGCKKTCHDNNDINNPPTQSRVRQCEGDTLDGGCDGEGEEIKACNQAVACPGSLLTWQNWQECPHTCRMGTIAPTHIRERKCIGGTWDGNCGEENPLFESKNCSVEIYCPGRLTLWSEYGPCGSRCNVAGLGPYQKRYRDCIDYSTWNPLFKGCAGFEREQAVLCNQDIPCKAVCSTTCNADATCTSPDTCICNTGYEGDGTTICNPVCSTTCHADATCTSPDTCICNTGYEGDGTTICNANCIPECHSNGVCANMNTCFCEKGYHGDGITSCEPVCSTTCHADATCSSPDTCTCKNGYEGDGTTTCNPNDKKDIASNDKLIIGCTAGGIVAFLILIIIILIRRGRKTQTQQNTAELSTVNVNVKTIDEQDNYLRLVELQNQNRTNVEPIYADADVHYKDRNTVPPDYENSRVGDLAETAVDLDHQDTTTLPSQYHKLTIYDKLKR